MGRIPRDVVDAVRDRTDIVEVVSRHVSMTRRGGNFVGLCPFHQEKSPSFNVNPPKGIFHCFGCGMGGDVFKFLMQLEGLSFVEAVKELAGPAGIPIEERELTPAERRALRQRSTLFDVLEAACAYFESTLWTRPEGAAGRDYLTQRDLSPETSRKARLGYAPDGWTRVLDHLHGMGFAAEQVLEAGLARPRKSGDGHYDTLRDRLIFPITDERGRVIAFGGRVMKGDGPKYLNTPETRLYQKSNVLYGVHIARQGIQQRDRVLVVEGYFDVLSLRQAGFPETVASCGTSLTKEHLERIRRLTRNVVLLLDADEAGLQAAERALPMLLASGIQPWRLDLPGAKDPDEFVREAGPDGLEAALAQRQPMLKWFVQRKLSTYGSEAGTGAMSRQRVMDDVVPLLVRVDDAALVSEVARRIGIHEAAFYDRLDQARRTAGSPDALPPPQSTGWRPHRDIVHLLWLLVHHYGRVADLVARANPELLAQHGPVRTTVARLVSGEPVAAILPDTDDPGVERTLSAVVARDRLYDEEAAPIALCHILDRLDKPFRGARLARWAEQMEGALAQGDLDGYRAAATARAGLVAAERQLEVALKTGDVDSCMRLFQGPA